MYHFTGRREAAELVRFAEGSLDKLSAKPIRGPRKWYDYHVIRAFRNDMTHIVAMRKNAAIVLFLSGVVFGAVVMKLMLRAQSKPSKPKPD